YDSKRQSDADHLDHRRIDCPESRLRTDSAKVRCAQRAQPFVPRTAAAALTFDHDGSGALNGGAVRQARLSLHRPPTEDGTASAAPVSTHPEGCAQLGIPLSTASPNHSAALRASLQL